MSLYLNFMNWIVVLLRRKQTMAFYPQKASKQKESTYLDERTLFALNNFIVWKGIRPFLLGTRLGEEL